LRLGWYPAFFVSLLILAAAVILVLASSPQGVTQSQLVFEDTAWNRGVKILTYMAAGLSSIVSVALAALVFRKRADTRMGLFLAYYLLGYGILLAGPIELLQPLWPVAPFVNSFLLLPIFMGPVTMALFATFPDGKFVPGWSRWLVVLSVLSLPASLLVVPEGIPERFKTTDFLVVALLFSLSVTVFVGALYVQIYRYRHVSTAAQRKQTKWVLYGMALWITVMILSSFSWMGAFRLPQGSTAPWWLPLGELAWVVSTVFLPLSLSVSILRHQLFDIDWVINRTMVYGGLTLGVLAVYASVVVATGLVMQQNAGWAGLLITAVATIAFFRPMKLTLQKGVDRWIRPENQESKEALLGRAAIYEPGQLGDEASDASLGKASPWGRAARGLWYPAAGVGLAIFLASLPGHVLQLTLLPHGGGLTIEPWSLPYVLNLVSAAFSVFASGLSLALAALLFWKRSKQAMAVILSYYLLAHGVIIAGPLEALEPFIPGIADFSVTYLGSAVVGPLSIALLALFPDGRFVPRWTRWVALGSILFIPLSLVVGHPDMRDSVVSAITLILYVLFFSTGFAMVYAQIHRQRTVSDPIQKQQGKWFVYGFGMWIGFIAISSIPYLYIDSLPPGAAPPPWATGITSFWWLATAILPVALTVAIMRYRLYEIDLIINRTLVYGALTASVVGIYALVVGGMGILFQSSGNVAVSLVATGLVAVLFQPLRQRLQQGVNRLTFGDREDPVTVLTTLGRQLEETVSPQAAMDGIVTTISHHLKLPFAAIEFENPMGPVPAASYGKAPQKTLSFPIVYQTELIGQLTVAPRSADEPLNDSDRLLLENVARQAGAAVKAARLAVDLQRSRQQLVTAREEERRRLRRDLHDGLGPQLASQTLTLDALEKRIQQDPDSAAHLLRNLKSQARESIRDIRRLVYDLRPPALDELGLVGAVTEVAEAQRHGSMRIRVEARTPLPPLPAAVEVAAFRIAQEGITNVVRHAQASQCRVELSLENHNGRTYLCLKIEDNGIGIPDTGGKGVGQHSMRERAEELGGSVRIDSFQPSGTRIKAMLPFPESTGP
jgi:signal transduction histidine kinase